MIKRQEYILGNFTEHFIDESFRNEYAKEYYKEKICHRRAILVIERDADTQRERRHSTWLESLDCCKAGKCSTWHPEEMTSWVRSLPRELELKAQAILRGESVQDVSCHETIVPETVVPEVEVINIKRSDEQGFELGTWNHRIKNLSERVVMHRRVMLKIQQNKQGKPEFKLVGELMKCCKEGYCNKSWHVLLMHGEGTGESVEIKDWSALPASVINKAMKIVGKTNETIEGIKKQNDSGREPIPDDVRLYVWQRDGGKCAKCGSQERLEYDHFIPISQGGSNTARNIQLLCEKCNRSKGGSII